MANDTFTVPVEIDQQPPDFDAKARALLLVAFDLLEEDTACGCGWDFGLGDYRDKWSGWKAEKAHMANGGVCPMPSDKARWCVDAARLLGMPESEYRRFLVSAGERLSDAK